MNNSGSRILATLFAESRVLTVSELTDQISDKLEEEFFAINVRGEISNFKAYPSGHWYFTLKDSGAQIRAVFFKQWNRLLRFDPENGLEVQVRGRLKIYKERGEYQLQVETMEPVGVGPLQLAFEQQVKRLSAEGFFSETRKRPLPKFPRRVGIVTSLAGAVIQDMLQILERRNRGINVIIAPVKVQGAGAAEEIADAIRMLNNYSSKPGCEIDVMIVGRGGGSMEDLWAFNEELVARAVYDSKIPVVSAVGHETDVTVIDFVADKRAPTPSAAVEIISAQADDMKATFTDVQSKLSHHISYHLLRRRHKLQQLLSGLTLTDKVNAARLKYASLKLRLESTDFKASISVKSSKLELLKKRMINAGARKMELTRYRYDVSWGKLSMLSPLSVLNRGYALVKDEDGRLLSSVKSVNPDDELIIRFADGEIRVQVI